MTIGTTNFGILYYENQGWKSIDLDTNYFKPGTIYNLAENNDYIWVQFKNGIAKFNFNWELIYINDTIPYDLSPHTLVLDDNNNPWFGNGTILLHINEGNLEIFDINR
ncbi:MAG: hypothetical protein K8R74_16965 [Bacteroidales bacterium]|nr:hypothetical protein [Bacteroidales bacterium]